MIVDAAVEVAERGHLVCTLYADIVLCTPPPLAEVANIYMTVGSRIYSISRRESLLPGNSQRRLPGHPSWQLVPQKL